MDDMFGAMGKTLGDDILRYKKESCPSQIVLILHSHLFLEPLFPMTFFRRDRFHLVHNITHKLRTVFSFEQKNAQTLSISLVKITFLQENTVLSLCVTL